MSRKGAETKGRLIDTTQALVESRGYFGTGLNQVLADSGAPRGSLYFHFPGGKDQLVGAAVSRASCDMGALINDLDACDSAELVRKLLVLLGDRLEQSNWNKGCPVATVALEVAASNDTIQQICSSAYTAWQEALRHRLRADGRDNADDLAVFLLAVLEGAMLLARTHRSRAPLEAVNRTVNMLL